MPEQGDTAAPTANTPLPTTAATPGVRATAASLEPSLPARKGWRLEYGGPPKPIEQPKTCAICGAKAIYVRPPEGRCSKHRDVITAPVVAYRRQMDGRSAAHGADCDHFDRVSKTAASRRGHKSCRIGQR